jgi:hypothetical protein
MPYTVTGNGYVSCPYRRYIAKIERMPLTTYHMGITHIVKPALTRRFSMTNVGIAQTAFDVEPAAKTEVGNLQCMQSRLKALAARQHWRSSYIPIG